MTPPRFVRLDNRALIHISGRDRFDFLQGLITQDLTKLEKQPLLYSCLLTAQGKFLYDFFIFQSDDEIILDCALDQAQQLHKKLGFYRLRKDVSLKSPIPHPVFALIDEISPQPFSDPRHSSLGVRCYETPDHNLQETSFDVYDQLRISLCIADGERDAWREKSSLAELGLDECAVSHTKGCYIGQELTARMKLRGLNKKSLTPVIFPNDYAPQKGDVISHENQDVGEVRSFCHKIGLCVLKHDFIDKIGRDANNFVDLSNCANVLITT